MEIITTVSAMQSIARDMRRSGRRIGFVPTMGFLHDGHLELMRTARKKSDVLVASIFVNPTQFGPNEDFECYPRDAERDQSLCESVGVDYLFFPPVEEVYASDASVYVDEEQLSVGLCGGSRKGHFRGVLTVVAKLFNMVLPDIAVFGQKDAQQAALIRRMVRDLNFPIDIVVAPIVREADGLAMSSRNAYLSDSEREQALWLSHSLQLAESMVAAGTFDAHELECAMRDFLAINASEVELEYIAIVDAVGLQPLEAVEGETLIALAARVGKTRLIDNIMLNPELG
jgi:pantoate--beta-alanine ligase